MTLQTSPPTQSRSSLRSSTLNKLGILASILLLTLSSPSQAQTDQDRLVAALTIINMYIMDAGVFSLDLNETDESEIPIEGKTEFQFTQQNEDVDLCFIVDGPTGFSAGELSLTINGVAVPAQNAPTQGENCYALSTANQESLNRFVFEGPAGVAFSIRRTSLEPTDQESLLLPSLTRRTWDEKAVRKVLRIFAFGGHALDAQIQDWADMAPKQAIAEMLTFEEHNLKLSPLADGEEYPITATNYGTLTAWQNFMSDESHADNPIPSDRRDQYGLDGYNFDDAYNRMITVRGLNPFRQKIGFWETNYHLALNLETDVNRHQMAYFYDIVMQAHESGVPYYQVLGEAAKSAAVAMQYGHRFNEWDEYSGECYCNDDFAREIHQLYYGIFGNGVDFHENVTIPETAKLLTDMEVRYNGALPGGHPLVVDFQTDEHHVDGVYIFKDVDGSPNVNGANASEKIDALMPLSMQHPESLFNLPIMIIEVLADDNLSESAKTQLRDSWASMGVERVLLDFLHAYAISDLFHGPDQYKFMTTHERALYIANKSNLDNLEAYFGGAYYNGGRAGRSVGGVISDDNAGEFFRPLHNVFGGQTSLEASNSTLAFENNYNRIIDREGDIRDAVRCSSCNLGLPWEKKWHTVLPRALDGQFYVEDVAAWLWKHAVGHLDNYTDLERAHLYSLLGASRVAPGDDNDGDYSFDFNLVMCAIRDYQYTEGVASVPSIVSDILTDRSSNPRTPYDDYCRGDDDGGSYLPHETQYLNGALTAQQLSTTGDGHFSAADFQSILADLGSQTLPLETVGAQHHDNGATLRKHARERIQAALFFIFTTPYAFAEAD